MTRTIVISQLRLSDEEMRQVRAAAVGYDVVEQESPSSDLIRTAEVFAGHIEPQQLALATALRWNHIWSAGADIDVSSEMRDAVSVALTSSAGNGGIPLAEHAILLMLMIDRDVLRWVRAQQDHRWDRFEHGELAGATVGIIGMGAAGRDLARKCRAFHMTVLGLRNRPEIAEGDVDEMFGPERILEFASRCDYLVVAAPLTAATMLMVNAEVIAAMKPTAGIVNISRGEIIDSVALGQAFKSGHLRRAGLDAHSEEPLPEDSSWWSRPGVVVTPHNGATTAQTRARGVNIFLRNVERYVQGRPLLNRVDKAAGYSV